MSAEFKVGDRVRRKGTGGAGEVVYTYRDAVCWRSGDLVEVWGEQAFEHVSADPVQVLLDAIDEMNRCGGYIEARDAVYHAADAVRDARKADG